eukprot:TRINITY_DN1880_c2_g1_i1.p1 TRINITY_DN1880_c2_g1~~TRINITY_DN1880_c2_g1_i1.p1  ORF type:complete len:255 (-),score=21.40 TRINITY_DN1880_c2_g1_i1:20-784(-)
MSTKLYRSFHSNRHQILLFGDSLTQHSFTLEHGGWALGLSEWYNRKADVVNRGFSGYNTTWALEVLDDVFGVHTCAPQSNEPRPLLVTIFFGANDAAVPEDGLQAVPLSQYEDNLVLLAKRLTEKFTTEGHTPKIVYITPPPVDEDAWFAHCQHKHGATVFSRTVDSTKGYAEACKKAAARVPQSICVPLYDELSKVTDWKSYFDDGLHFNVKGNAFLLKLLCKTLEEQAPEVTPDHIPLPFVEWADMAARTKK